jgi:hypothetical protein
MTTRDERAAHRASTPLMETRARVQLDPKRQRMRLALDTGEDGAAEQHEEGEVSHDTRDGSWTLPPPDDDDPDDEDDSDHGQGSSGRQGDEATGGDGPERTPPTGRGNEDDDARRPTRRPPGRDSRDEAPPRDAGREDDLESMAWWDDLSPNQQLAIMKRFVLQPPAAAPVIPAAPAATPAPAPSSKKLLLDDFHGNEEKAVEAWLATIPQEVQRQLTLGGSTWTTKELYYGVTAHLKGSREQVVHRSEREH